MKGHLKFERFVIHFSLFGSLFFLVHRVIMADKQGCGHTWRASQKPWGTWSRWSQSRLGQPGARGADGKKGAKGEPGIQGSAGQKGQRGDKGDSGTSRLASHMNWKECAWKKGDGKDSGLIYVSTERHVVIFYKLKASNFSKPIDCQNALVGGQRWWWPRLLKLYSIVLKGHF